MHRQLYEAALAHIVQGDLALRPLSKERGIGTTFGGKVESSETPEAAIVRELWEEVGIKPREMRRLPDRGVDWLGHAARIAVFVVTAWEGEPRNLALQEHSDVRWFTCEEIECLPMQEEARREVLGLLRARAGTLENARSCS